jgi:hypothetical protein
MLLRVSLFALLLLATSAFAKHHDDDHDDHEVDHHPVAPSPAAPPTEDWRKYVPPEYQHYIPEQPVPDHEVSKRRDPNEEARARYDPSYDQYGRPYVEHDEDHEHDDDHDKDHHDKDHDKHHDKDKDHDKHKKHAKDHDHDKHDKHHDKHDKHDDKKHDKHHDKHDKHDKHDDKHHKSKHSKKHSKHSFADIDEMNNEYDDGLFFSRSEDAVDHVQQTADGTHNQSTWSWFGMIALFLIGAVVALVMLYWVAACVVAYMNRRRYSQLQTKSGWADEEAMGINNYVTA